MKTPTHHFAAVVSYDGSNYYGWQRLREHSTIQGALEDAVLAATGEECAIRGAGRTDRGTHAEGQVAGISLARDIDPGALAARLNDVLAADIRVRDVRRVAADFHVRTDAIEKTYSYRIVNREAVAQAKRAWHLREPLDAEAMAAAAAHLVGEHDFASFATKPRFAQRSTTREIYQADVERSGDELTLTFRANSFLNHMVRNMVCALARVGDGRYQPSDIKTILGAKARSASPGSAPACGLTLVCVRYE